MIGGVGGEAIYIVGHHEDNIIILDPHYVQSEKDGEGIYFKKTPRGMSMKKLACSVAFAFYFSSKK